MKHLIKWWRRWRQQAWWEREGRDMVARDLDYEICKMQIQLQEKTNE